MVEYSNELYQQECARIKYQVGSKFKFVDTFFYPKGTVGEIVEILPHAAFNKANQYKILLNTGETVVFSQENIDNNAFGIVPANSTSDYPLAEASWLNCF